MFSPGDYESIVLNFLAGYGPAMEPEIVVGLGHGRLVKITPAGRWVIEPTGRRHAVFTALKRLQIAGAVESFGGGRGKVGRYRITNAGQARRAALPLP